MGERTRIALLGATGSIGTQTIDVVRMHPDLLEVTALAAGGSRPDALAAAARELGAAHVAVASRPSDGSTPADASSHEGAPTTHTPLDDLADLGIEVAYGSSATCDLCSLDDVDLVVNALSGAAGVRASYATLRAGKRLALANKESLVVAGELIMPLATTGGNLLPVDSEHSAIWQCLAGEDSRELYRIWLTCSGGPFRGRSRGELAAVTAADALAHPTWSMGPKITIDSATLMNKGLEVIEAMHLFGVGVDDIRVVVHPQSVVHSMVEYADGSVKAQAGVADMRVPIQYALTFPHRSPSPAEHPDFTQMPALSFEDADVETFRCLALALEAGRAGGTLPAVMNAANEVAVAAFLSGACRLTDIDACVESVMASHDTSRVEGIDQLADIDRASRIAARGWLEAHRL